MRVVSVVLGSTSMKAREDASAALLNYAFNFYDTKLAAKGGTKLASTPALRYARCSIVVPLNIMSRPLVMSNTGGIPCRSANTGDSTGSRESAVPT